jgi:fibronectin-binding autotransporter adhesin
MRHFQPTPRPVSTQEAGVYVVLVSFAARIAASALALGAVMFAGTLSSVAASPKKPPRAAGALTQLAGAAGCISKTGSAPGCAHGRALDAPSSVAVSPDGRNVYVTGGPDAVAVFARNSKTGALAQLSGPSGCVSLTGSGGSCARGRALESASSVTVSPDGRNVYIASFFSDGIASFARDPGTGALSQLAGKNGCVTETGSGGACATGTELFRPTSVTVSPGGRNVYVASSISNAVDVFSRNGKTGVLVQLLRPQGCVSESGSHGACVDGRGLRGARAVAVSPDGTTVYVAAGQGERSPIANVAVFGRDPALGVLTQSPAAAGCLSENAGDPTCPAARGLEGATSILVSGDGRNVYVGSSSGLAAFARTAITGALRQLAGHASAFAVDSIALSPDGLSVYAASGDGNSIAAFARAVPSGALRQLPAPDGCVGAGAPCLQGSALRQPDGVAVSRDGRNVYVVSGLSDAVAVFARRP